MQALCRAQRSDRRNAHLLIDPPCFVAGQCADHRNRRSRASAHWRRARRSTHPILRSTRAAGSGDYSSRVVEEALRAFDGPSMMLSTNVRCSAIAPVRRALSSTTALRQSERATSAALSFMRLLVSPSRACFSYSARVRPTLARISLGVPSSKGRTSLRNAFPTVSSIIRHSAWPLAIREVHALRNSSGKPRKVRRDPPRLVFCIVIDLSQCPARTHVSGLRCFRRV
jgi:hypothetical protein